MTFANVQFQGNVPEDDLGAFYLVGPQDDTPQSEEATFAHDHTVSAAPRHNSDTYSAHLQTFLLLCSAEGITGGACVPTSSPLPGLGDPPLVTTVNRRSFTSVEAIEAARAAGLVTPFDVGQVIVGTISGG